jgi:hypothetical protein
MNVLASGCGSDKRDVRHQCASDAEVDASLATVGHGQRGRDGGAGGDRLEEFGAVNSLAPERRVGERFEVIQALRKEQNSGDDWCPGEVTRECGVIGGNAERSGHASGFGSGGAHLSTAP